jgi:hypothetical protein
MWKVGNIAPVSVLGVDSAYGFNITTERGQPLVFFAYATQVRAACDTTTALKARFKPSTHLAVRLPASHMTLSQADPTGSMTPWRQF